LKGIFTAKPNKLNKHFVFFCLGVIGMDCRGRYLRPRNSLAQRQLRTKAPELP
jgi:hypothetical protein